MGVHYFVLPKRFRILATENLYKDILDSQKICQSVFALLFGYTDQLNNVRKKTKHLTVSIIPSGLNYTI